MTWWRKLKPFKISSNSASHHTQPRIKHATPILLYGVVIGGALIYSENYFREGVVSLATIKVSTYSDDLSASLENSRQEDGTELLFTLENKKNETKLDSKTTQQDKPPTTKIKSPISVLFDQALLLSREGKQHDAIEIYNKIIHQKPNHQMATINLALLLKKSGDYPAAIQTLEHALAISGSARKGKIYALLGSCNEALEQHTKAIKQYNNSIEFRPSHALTWRRLARASSLASRPFPEVLEAYNRAIALNPNDAAVYLEKAQFQLYTLDFEGLITTLTNKQIPKLNRQEHKLNKNRLLTLSYNELGRINKAKQQAKIFQKILPKNALNKDLALIAIIKKRYKHALSLLKSSSFNEATYLKAMSLQLLGNTEEANALWQSLLDDQRFTFLAQLNLAQFFAHNGQKQQALTVFTGLLSKAIYSANVAYKMSRLSIDLKQEQSAYHYANLALSTQPNRRKYLLLIAEVDLQFGKLNQAFNQLEALSLKYPKSRSILRQWARTLESTERYPAAIEKYRLLTASNEKKSDLLALAKLLIKANNIEASNKVLNVLLEKHTGHIEARYLLAENLCQNNLQDECHYQADLVLKLDKTHVGAKILMSEI